MSLGCGYPVMLMRLHSEETFPVTTSDDAPRSKAEEAPKKETPSRSTSFSGNSTEKADKAGRDLWR
eukprot:3716443-Prymnesium_polylepis.1